MSVYLLDSDILCHVLRRSNDKDKTVFLRLRDALVGDSEIILSPIAYYEVYRGLLRRNAVGQMRLLEELTSALCWDDLLMEDFEAASRIWVDCMSRDRCPDDADPIIAAHAIRLGATVVTNNEKHFKDLNVPIENWLK